jgi:hypothetical protein
MEKRKPKRFGDPTQLARQLVTESTDEQLPTKAQISQLMASLGRKGGKIGGKRRLETMTASERSAIASKAAKARWKEKK